MKKAVIGVILLIVIAIAGVLYYVLTNLDSIVEGAIEKYGSQATQTAVRVDSVKITLVDGAGAINGLTVANPQGFAAPNAFSLSHVSTRIDPQSVTSDPIVIDDITVKAAQLYYEINADRQANLNVLKDNMASSAPSQPEPSQETEPEEGAEPRLIIRRLQFSESTLNAKIVPLNNKEYQLKLPKIDMVNLGGEQGATGAQIAQEILSRLTDQAIEQIKKQGIDKEVEKLKAQATEKVEAEKARLKEKVDSKIEAEQQKAEEKLKDLFK